MNLDHMSPLEIVRLMNREDHKVAPAVALELPAIANAVNGILEVSTDTLDANGMLTRSYGVAIGSMVVSNPNSSNLVVASGAANSNVAPTKGVGVFIVPANSVMTVAIDHHAFTFYGSAANTVSFQVFTGLQAYGVQ